MIKKILKSLVGNGGLISSMKSIKNRKLKGNRISPNEVVNVGFHSPVVLLSTAQKERGIFGSPIRHNKFVMTFPEDIDIPSWCINSFTMPSWSGSWNPIEIKIINTNGFSTAQRVFHNLRNSESFQIRLQMIDPIETDRVSQQWSVSVRNIESIDFGGTNNYSDDGVSIITIKMNVNNCVLNF